MEEGGILTCFGHARAVVWAGDPGADHSVVLVCRCWGELILVPSGESVAATTPGSTGIVAVHLGPRHPLPVVPKALGTRPEVVGANGAPATAVISA